MTWEGGEGIILIPEKLKNQFLRNAISQNKFDSFYNQDFTS